MFEQHHRPLHIFFFPFLAYGHIIPTINMAKLFASRRVKSTIITTPLNAPFISKSLSNSPNYNTLIHILTIDFPHTHVGLPQGSDNIESIPSPDLTPAFFKACSMLQHPLEQLLQQSNPLPDCIIADMFFPWATDSAAKFGIPRIVFHVNGFFSLCASECVRLYKPYENVSSDSEPFVIPNLPGDIKMTSSQVPDLLKKDLDNNEISKLLTDSKESEIKSYGVVVNSFYELEKEYADYYRNVLKRKAWHIGPVSLCNTKTEEKANRGKETSIDEHECLKWLDTKKPNSVVYVCFGSVANFPESQLREIAMGLEASGQDFIWVVRKTNDSEESWLPSGFEKRMELEGRGMIIRGWAPQILILEHEAIEAFVSHCGWNSTMEAICAGVPMVTWPVSAYHFYTEKFITEVLRIGVPVGIKKWVRLVGDSVKWDTIEKAVKKTMEGEEAEEMRNRAKALAQKAKEAMENGGSSYSDLNSLIDELASH